MMRREMFFKRDASRSRDGPFPNNKNAFIRIHFLLSHATWLHQPRYSRPIDHDESEYSRPNLVVEGPVLVPLSTGSIGTPFN